MLWHPATAQSPWLGAGLAGLDGGDADARARQARMLQRAHLGPALLAHLPLAPARRQQPRQLHVRAPLSAEQKAVCQGQQKAVRQGQQEFTKVRSGWKRGEGGKGGGVAVIGTHSPVLRPARRP